MNKEVTLRKKSNKYSQLFGLMGIILVLCVIFILLNTAFIMPENLMNIVRQASANIILAVGVTFVMVSGEMDLSIGGIMCLVGMAVALMTTTGVPVFFAIIIGLCIGAGVGFLNGYISTKFGLPSMIVSLATMNICNGFSSMLTGGTAVYGLPETFSFLGRGYIGPFPVQVVLMVVFVIVGAVVLSKTLYGRYAYAIGGNETVTKLAGVNVFRYKILYFTVCGICASVAGIIYTSRMMTGQPTLGATAMMDILTAVVIGGAAIAGSGGGIWGSLLGAILLTVVSNGLTINGVNSFWQLIINAVILLVVIIVRKVKRK